MSRADIDAAINAGRALTALAQSPANLGPNDQEIANAITAVQRVINASPKVGENKNLDDGLNEFYVALEEQPANSARINAAITQLNSALGALKKGGRRHRKTRKARRSTRGRTGRKSTRL
jgi:hypothetical protein